MHPGQAGGQFARLVGAEAAAQRSQGRGPRRPAEKCLDACEEGSALLEEEGVPGVRVEQQRRVADQPG
jgi:hypothetical protein